MNPLALAFATAAINGGIEIWRTHLGKPAGWVPTAQDLADMDAAIDAASPEAVKAAAAERLGIVWPPPEM